MSQARRLNPIGHKGLPYLYKAEFRLYYLLTKYLIHKPGQNRQCSEQQYQLLKKSRLQRRQYPKNQDLTQLHQLLDLLLLPVPNPGYKGFPAQR